MEQVRLQLASDKAIELIFTSNENKTVLDFGLGTVNLTNHLLKFGIKVTAADVSDFFEFNFIESSK